MRAVSLHPDVIVVTSRVWQTNCTLLRGGEEAFVIDSPVYPDELEMLPAVLEQARFAATGLLATHGDWDHLLGRLAFSQAPLGVSEATAARLRSQPGAAQRELREFDQRHYVRRALALSLGDVQALPVPGRCELGESELELYRTDGHTVDGMALWAPWAGVLVCGDYLSDVEIPVLSPGGSLDAYLATLGRLRALVEQAEWVIPGHGAALGRGRAMEILERDHEYLEGLRCGGSAGELPAGRRGSAQRAIHVGNVELVQRFASGVGDQPSLPGPGDV